MVVYASMHVEVMVPEWSCMHGQSIAMQKFLHMPMPVVCACFVYGCGLSRVRGGVHTRPSLCMQPHPLNPAPKRRAIWMACLCAPPCRATMLQKVHVGVAIMDFPPDPPGALVLYPRPATCHRQPKVLDKGPWQQCPCTQYSTTCTLDTIVRECWFAPHIATWHRTSPHAHELTQLWVRFRTTVETGRCTLPDPYVPWWP